MSDLFDLTSGQEAIWFHNQVDAGYAPYNINAALRITPGVESEDVARAFSILLSRHDALRANFFLINGKLQQRMDDEAQIKIVTVAAQDLHNSEIRARLRAISNQGFDLQKDCLLRCTLFQQRDATILHFQIHHIISDFWSISLLFEELMEMCSTSFRKQGPTLERIGISYREYCEKSVKWLTSPAAEKAKFYWQEKLGGTLPVLDLLARADGPGSDSTASHNASFSFSISDTKAVLEFAGKHRVSVYATLLAAYARLLSHINAQSEIVIGVPMLGRRNAAEKFLCGYLVNPLPVRICGLRQRRFEDLVKSIGTDVRAAMANSRYPFSLVVKNLGLDRDLDTTPVYQTMFSFQRTRNNGSSKLAALAVEGNEAHLKIGHLSVSSYPYDVNVSQFGLALNMGLADEQLSGAILYRESHFSQAAIDKLTHQFKKIVLDSLKNDHPQPIPETDSIWDRLAACFTDRDEAIALEYMGATIYYRELPGLSEVRRLELISSGIECGDTVAIILPQSSDLILTILALLKLKCRLVVADQKTPPQRLDLILNISRCKFSIVASEQQHEVRRLAIDIPAGQSVQQSTESEVYVFTSGSTGIPKCVTLTEENLLAMASAMSVAYRLTQQDRILQFTSPGFDVFWEELLTTLMTGATLVIRPPELSIDFEQFESFLQREMITVINLPTAFWDSWLKQIPVGYKFQLPQLHTVIVGGEEMSCDTLGKWQQVADRKTRLINAYGPSEASITTMLADVTKAPPDTPVPIGLPVAGVEVLVLDKDDRQVDMQDRGVLYLSGNGLSPGYFADQKSTRERFVKFGNSAKRWFNTGDLVQRGKKGEWIFVGRLDRQIKRHGVRIELDEIELHVSSCTGVSRCAVMPIGQKLIACIETTKDFSIDDLRHQLEQKLLIQMIPTDYREYDNLPVTAAGKIDMALLHEHLTDSSETQVSDVGRGGDSNREIHAIVQNHVASTLGDNDNFFELGVDSILAVSIAAELSDRFTRYISVRAIFENPTVSELDHYFQSLPAISFEESATGLQPATGTASVPLTPGQARAIYLKEVAGQQFNTDLCIELLLEGTLDTLVFHNAWIRTLSANQIFQCDIEDGKRQSFSSDQTHQLVYIDDTSQPSQINDIALFETTLAVQKSPLIKAALVKRSKRNHSLFVAISPCISDPESIARLFAQFADNYHHKVGTVDDTPPPLDISFRNYAVSVAALPNASDYWNGRLQECDTAPQLHIRDDKAVATFVTDTLAFELVPAASHEIVQLCSKLRVTPATFFLTAFFVLLNRYSESNVRMGVGMAVSHRGLFGTKDTLGPFTNFVIIDHEITGETGFNSLVRHLHSTLLGAIEHQHIDIHDLLSNLGEKSGLLPIENLYLYHDKPLPAFELGDLKTSLKQHGATVRPALLSLEITRRETGFLIEIHYDTGKYKPSATKALGAAFQRLLKSIVVDPDSPVSDLLLLPENLSTLGRGAQQLWQEPCELLHTTFTLTARKHPFRTAFIVGGRSISYSQTYRLSTRVSHAIFDIRQSLPDNQPLVVGIIMDKGWEQIVTALGIMRGGGVYAPINPSLPHNQIVALLKAIGIKLIITTTLGRKSYDWPDGVEILTLDDKRIRRASLVPIRKRTVATKPDDPAYIMFTSGTTGLPKAVMISHRAALNTIYDLNQRLQLKRDDVFFGISNFHFDLSVYDLFGAFSRGARIVLPDPERLLDTEHWEQLLREHNVTIWNSVPALYRLMLDQLETPLPRLRHVLLSGDWIPLELPALSRVRAPQAQLLSLGGATEGSIWSIGFSIDEVGQDWSSIPYGLPLNNQNIYVLDSSLQPCPPDVPGELHIGGDGVAMEYFRQPELTQAAFVIEPQSGERLYKTNDLGLLSSRGYFEILGRIDNQVKISGQFVNLGAVEAELESVAAVTNAAVVGVKEKNKRTELRAFVVSERLDVQFVRELRAHLARELPGHMVPAKFALLDRLPLTDNGKVDRSQLSEFQGEFVSFRSHGTAARSEMEISIAKIWEEVLEISNETSNISVNDNFFDLGGDSLLAVQAASLLQKSLNLEVPIQTLIANQTIGTLAAVLEGNRRASQFSTADTVTGEMGMLQGVLPETLLRESFLDDTIAIPKNRITSPNRESFLLTGATGYLGSRLLLELLSTTDADIYCITRADDSHAAEERIFAKLATISPLSEADEKRIIPVKGDLRRPLLGLTNRDYDLLAEQVDYILHCAAEVNFVLPRSALRDANVGGATEILRLAAHCKPAAVGYVSTVSVFPTIGQNIEKRFMEDDDLDQGIPIVGGYSQSKLIAENNMRIGRERGIPISIFRPGVIFGDTRQGDLPSDVLLVSFMQLCAKMEMAPDLNLLVDIAPVDYVANAIVALSAAQGGNYHLTNPKPIPLNDFVARLRDVGLKMETVAQSEWFDKAKQLDLSAGSGAAEVLLGMATDLETIGSIAFGRNLQQFDCSNTLEGLAQTAIRCPEIDTQFLQKFARKFRRV